MYFIAEKERCLAAKVPRRGGSKPVVATLREVVALGFVALASYETLEPCAW